MAAGIELLGSTLATVSQSSRLIGDGGGWLTAVGLLALPGIIARIDAPDTAQWYVSTALYVGGLGWNILYTIWCIWLGRLLLSNRLVLQLSTTGAQSVQMSPTRNPSNL